MTVVVDGVTIGDLEFDGGVELSRVGLLYWESVDVEGKA